MEIDLLELVEHALGIREVPVEKELIDDGEILSGFGESREDFLHVALGLLFDQAAKFGEEPGGLVARGAPDAAGCRWWPTAAGGGGESEGFEVPRGRSYCHLFLSSCSLALLQFWIGGGEFLNGHSSGLSEHKTTFIVSPPSYKRVFS